MKLIDRMVEYFTGLNKKMKRWQRVVSILSAIVVFATTYMLVMPAITLDVDTASTQAGIEVASENEPDTAGTVFESTEEEEPEEPEAEPAEEEETSGSVSSAQEEEAEPASEQEEAVESDSEQEEAVESAPAEQEEESAEPASDEQEEEAEEAQSGSSETEAAQSGSGSADSTAAEDSSEDASVQEAADAAKTTAETAKTTAETSKTAVTEDTPLIKEPTQLTYKGNDYTVYADFDESAKLPVGVELRVKEITKDSDPDAYDTYYKKALEELKDKYDENTGLSFAKFYDIAFVYKGQEIEPQGNVAIKIEYKKAVEIEEETKIDTIHFDKEDEDKVEIIDSEKEVTDKTKVESVEFESDKFSVYGVIGAETFTEKYLTEDGETYNISVTAGPEAHIPSDARLEVSEVKAGSDKYNELFAKAEEAVLDGRDGSVPFARFFDISIVKDGEKIQPDVPVEVKITFDETVEADKNAVFNAVHISGNKTDVIDVTTEGEESEKAVTVEAVQFSADGFSIYGVTYTVDFETADGGSYSMFGKGEIKLSDLMSVLGIPEDIDNVTNASIELVEQNDENVDADELYIEKTDGDWLIKSDVAFGNVYSLTIKMNNGATYLVTITDDGVPESSDLSNFVTNVMISGATQNSDGQYEVEEGKEYAIKIFFAEGTDYQFKNDATLTYQMPSGIKVLTPQSGVAVMHIVYNNRTYDVDYHYSLSTDGRLEIEFDQTDPDYRKLTDSTNVSFNFTYNGQFDKNTTHLDFGSDVERDIVFKDPEPGQAYVTKTANFDENTGRFTYTITVTATGDVNNVNVKDVISGDALIFNNDVSVTGNSVNYIDNGAVNGFDYTFPSMQEGETITITYTANTDFSKDTDKDGTITADQTKNTVTVQPEGGEPHTSEYSRVIEFKKTDKKDGTIVDTEDGDKIIEWTIEYNSLALASAAGDTITDTIGASSAAYMEYYGDGITVNVYDHSGHLVGTRNVDYEDLTAHSSTSWTYTIPNGDTTPYKYVITYKTKVDMDKVEDGGVPVTLNNVANNDGGSTVVTPSNMAEITKRVADQTEQYVEWESVITVPENGLSSAVVVDTFPAIWRKHVVPDAANDENIYEQYIADSLYIPEQDLLPGESYTLEVTDTNLKITFFKDSAKTQTGLQGTPGGHQITIRLKTKVDPEWLQKNYDSPADNNSREHVNTISINGRQATATALFSKPSLDKKGPKNVQTWTDWSDGQKKYKFLRYEIWLKGVKNEPVTVTDSFDTSILKLVDPYVARGDHANLYEHMVLYGGDYTDQADKKPTPVLHTDTADGFSITIDELPKNDDGQFYQNYKIVYYLQLKDGVDLDQLAIANGGVYKLINTAQWGEFEKTFTYETKYKFLDKKLLNEGALGNTERTAQYQITFNPAKAMLNNGDIMEMTDTLSSNLSVDYSSIHIETDPAGLSVPYTLGGGEDGTTIATYKVPDATTVTITYNAFVRGNGYQTIVNKVKVKGEEDTVTNTKSYGTATEGQGAIPKLKIVKVDGYDANKKLAGVKFLVFAENPNLDFGPNTEPEPHAKEIILTTNENGEIVLDGTQYTYYLNQTLYHVREIEAPSNYGNLSFDYKVRMTNNMDEVHYAGADSVYYFTDTVQIKNWPLEGLVVEKQVESDDEADHDQYYTFKVSILDEEGNVDTEYNEKNGDDQFVNGVVEFELKDKEQKMFWGFKKGTKYKVEEIDSKGLATEVTYSVYGEDGSKTDTITETGKAHSGTFTQEDEVIIFKNSKTQQTGSLKITKVVETDGGGAIGTLADGTYTFAIKDSNGNNAVGKVNGTDIQNGQVTITIVNGQSNTVEVTDLNAGEYTITEISGDNKAVTLDTAPKTVTVTAGKSGDDVPTAGIASFTNRYEKTSVSVKKVWDGDANRPGSITVELIADGEDTGKSVELTSADDWAAKEISDLPKYNAATGEEIHYTWSEGPVSGYLLTEVTVDENRVTTLTNTETEFDLKTSYIGTKTWSDLNNKYNTRTENLTIVLQQSKMDSSGNYGAFTDTSYTYQWVTPLEGDSWTYKFENIPVYDENGNPYHYQAKETAPGNYSLESTAIEDTEYNHGSIYEIDREESCSTTIKSIPLSSEIDLAYCMIKLTENDGYLIWTHRAPTAWEIDQIKEHYKKEYGKKTVLWASGEGTVAAGKSSITFDIDISESGTVSLDLSQSSEWSILWYGNFAGSSYSSGSTTFTNKLIPTELTGKKIWTISGDETPADPILTLTRTYTTAAEGGTETTSEPETVRDQDGNALQPDEWTGTGKERTFKYKDLPAKDSNGNPYTYSVVEYQFTVGGITYTVTQNTDGTFTATPSDPTAPEILVTQENNDISNTEVTDFEVTKIWKDQSGQNVEWVKNITVILHKKSGSNETTYTYTVKEETSPGGAKTYTAASIDTDAPTAVVTGNARDGYTIKWSRLPIGFEYSATETKVDGYKDPIYAIKATDSDDGFINTENGTVLTNAGNGRYIINKPDDAVTLPESGGPGTALFYGMGIALMAMAGLLLFIKRRNIKNLSERRW